MLCKCKSGKRYEDCCKKYSAILNITPEQENVQPLLLEWLEIYSSPIANSFLTKSRKYLHRISVYLDSVLTRYLNLGLPDTGIYPENVILWEPLVVFDSKDKQELYDAFGAIKNNILLTIQASVSCLSLCLYMQSGTLLRSAIESSMVLLDIIENEEQLELLLEDKYSTNSLLTRVKNYVPKIIIKWYGHFTKNFSHFGPLHVAPHMPRKCYPDNYILVTGIENVNRAIICYSIILERLYYNYTSEPFFWKRKEADLVFQEDNKVFDWHKAIGQELVSEFPPSEKKEGMFYTDKKYKPK